MNPADRKGLSLGGPHLVAVRVLMSNFMEAAARFPRASEDFSDAYEQADRLADKMRVVDAKHHPESLVELTPEDSLILARLLERSVRWIPEFDEIQTLTGFTLDEVMQFYLDVKRALGIFQVDDEEMAEGKWESRVRQYPLLPRFPSPPRAGS